MGAVMKSARAVMQFEPAPDVLLQTGKGFKVEKSLGWIKFSAFINPDQEDDPETCVYWEAGFTQRCGLPVTNGKHRYCDAHQLIVDIPKDRILSYSH